MLNNNELWHKYQYILDRNLYSYNAHIGLGTKEKYSEMRLQLLVEMLHNWMHFVKSTNNYLSNDHNNLVKIDFWIPLFTSFFYLNVFQ